MYARDAFASDRANWKGVILLNVIRCMQRVVDALVQADTAEEDDSAEELSPDAPPSISSLLTDSHRRKCLRLRASLDLAEQGLKARLNPSHPIFSARSRPVTAEHLVDGEAEHELAVQAHTAAFDRSDPDTGKGKSSRRLSVLPPDLPTDYTDLNDPANLLHMCKQDMIDVWFDPTVQSVLLRRKVRWQEWPGLYASFYLQLGAVILIPF
jgi:guanine nucleotide-binding protein subunit alpha